MDPVFGSGSNFWNLLATREGSDGTSVDDDALLAPNHYYNGILASSAFSPPFNDYLVVNGNSGAAPNTAYFPQIHNFSTVGGSYSIEWLAGNVTASTSITDSMGSAALGRVYDTFLSSGTTYYLGLRPAAGNTSNYALDLHSATPGAYQGRPSAVADSGNVPPGQPALIHYATTADPSQFDGIVVLNNNGGSGSYTLYRDTQAPSGTISIDGGAAVTYSTTLSLALSATNPTPGDPVFDMAFSVNGGPYGAFQPYSTSATIAVPGGSGKKTVSVEFRNGAGGVGAAASDSIRYQAPPTVTSVSPNGGPIGGGDTVTLKGTDFTGATAVKFGATTATGYTVVSGTKITATTPAHSAGTINVTVTTPAGKSPTSQANRYTYESAPTVTAVSPNGGPTGGGKTVTITGTNFTAATAVDFGGAAASGYTVVNATKITAKTPAHSAGTVNVVVTTPAGKSPTSQANRYTYEGAPTATSVSPNTGPTGGGQTVTFTGATAVKFGATAASSYTVVSATKITAKTPAHSAGTVNAVVVTAAGKSPTSQANRYTFQ